MRSFLDHIDILNIRIIGKELAMPLATSNKEGWSKNAILDCILSQRIFSPFHYHLLREHIALFLVGLGDIIF